LQVLEGANKIPPKIKGIQIEFSLSLLYESQSFFLDILNYIINLEFEIWDILLEFREKQSGRLSQFDGIFFCSL